MLQQTERFQKDISRYQAAIVKLGSEAEQLEAKRLLNDLVHEVKNLDSMYTDMVYGKQLPTMGKDMREKIISIRKNLESKLFKNKDM